ncbi:MAG: branched-chain amino acid ABC transporter permease [Phycisphaerales bacterium]|nr:branched-chain amino acid ABC transporter permease [Phycisphaerales bacterium]
MFVETLLNGLAVGSVYALIALGYTMVYGILKFINFAHSDVVTWGAWVSFTIAAAVAAAIGWTFTGGAARPAPLWLGPTLLVCTMLVCGAIGFAIERLAYKPLRSAPRLNVLITAIGVSLLLQNVGQLQFSFLPGWLKFPFGTQPQSFPQLLPAEPLATVIGVKLYWIDLIGFGTAVSLMVALEWLVYHTKTGRMMRAVSYDVRTAALMGIPVDRIISFTFVLGSMLAAAAGLLYVTKYPGNLLQTADTTWVLLGLKAFVAAVVGGIGNIRGAMLGGFLIGLIELFGARYLDPGLRDVYVFSILILVLLFKPTGLLGSTVREKV